MQEGKFQCYSGRLYSVSFLLQLLFITAYYVLSTGLRAEVSEVNQTDQPMPRRGFQSRLHLWARVHIALTGLRIWDLGIYFWLWVFISTCFRCLQSFSLTNSKSFSHFTYCWCSAEGVWGAIFISKCIEKEWELMGWIHPLPSPLKLLRYAPL